MIERLKKSAPSSNFWNNTSTIVSGLVLMGLLFHVQDPETVRQMIWAYLGSTGVHNLGNVAQHLFKD